MDTWTGIFANAKRHGDFAGRNQAEQDAYFAHFAGAERGLTLTLRRAARRALRRLGRLSVARTKSLVGSVGAVFARPSRDRA